MKNKIESWLLNVFLGKLVARGVVLATAWLVGQSASVHVQLDPAQVSGALMLFANWLFEWIKARRMANPLSPAVQTDASKSVS